MVLAYWWLFSHNKTVLPACSQASELRSEMEKHANDDDKRDLLMLQYRVGLIEVENMELEVSFLHC